MLPARPWLLVFDLDGTLIDSSLDLCHAVNAALQHVGAPVLPHEVISSYIGDGAETLMRRALGQASHHTVEISVEDPGRARLQQALRFFLEFYRVHKLDNTRLHAGVLQSLQAIRATDPVVQMAVLTNKPVRVSQEICSALGIEPFFFAVYGGNSFPTKKPDPLGLLTIVAQGRSLLQSPGQSASDATLEQVVMIGDSATDVLTARNAGALSLGCLYGLAPESFRATPPDMLCHTAEEWPERLGFSPALSVL